MVTPFDGVRKHKILIVGATGLVGRELVRLLKAENHDLRYLTTNKSLSEKNESAFFWDWQNSVIDEKAFEGIEVVINLAGASIAGGLWTKKRKQLIFDSRVKGTRFLFEKMSALGVKLKSYVGASATGFYGPNNTYRKSEETDPPGEGFLAEVCIAWEKEHDAFRAIAERVVIPRISNVLAKDGGFLLPFFMMSKFGFRIIFTKSEFHISWIHVDDLARFISTVNYMPIDGVYNMSAGTMAWINMQYKIFNTLGDQIIRMILPKWFLKIAAGEMSTLLIDGNAVSDERLESTGFMIKHIDFDQTIRFVKESPPENRMGF